VTELIAFPIDNGKSGDAADLVLVEVNAPESGVGRAARPGEVVERASKTLDAALDVIRPTADALVAKIRALSNRPEEVTAEFGIKLTAKAGAVIVEGQSEGHITVTLSWKTITPSPNV
jgi:hypothetical protein